MQLIKTPLSFQNQLTLMMLIVLTVTLGAVISFTYLKINKDLTQSLIDQAVLQAKMIAEKNKNLVSSRSDRKAKLQLEQLSKTASIKAAAILLSNQSLLAYYPDQQSLSLLDLSNKQPLTVNKDNLLIVESITQHGQLIGYIYIYHDLIELGAHERNYLIVFVLIFLIIWFMSMQLAKYFQSLMTDPIIQMLAHINGIYKTGNFEQRLNIRSNDEIAELTQGFNQVLAAVQERENELTMHSKQLQRLVEVRTEQLYKKAHFDSLTGLPNRYLLVDRLHQAITKAARNHSILAVLFLDLDRFKVINDNLGHQNGDLLLKEAGKRLLKLSRETDTVARLGGDEFVFLLEDLSSPKDPVRTARRIINSFETPFHLQDHILHITTSIGISVYPGDGLNFETLLQNADISMYHAKNKGPGNFSFYTSDMNESSLERLKIESNLRTAIENEEFYLVYQPQLNLKDNSCRNVEALLRWKNKDVGLISPEVYVRIAEETGIINKIDLWVISQACQQIKSWNEQGFSDMTVAINVSAGHLISDSLLEYLKEQIEINQINASQIEIEITEAVFIKHTERTVKTLHALKALGFRIAIDDFGTGYSSLQYIQDFPADTLKLDGMFIRDLENNETSQGIVQSTIILAHSLGLELVTECVENQFQLDFIRKQGGDLIQGYIYAKPLMPDALPDFCKKTYDLN